MRESVIEKYLVKCVKRLGGEVRKVAWVGRKGAPDRLVMLPQRVVVKAWTGKIAPRVICAAQDWAENAATIWVELKATDKKPEPHQLREHKRMRKMGQRVEVIDSIEAVDNLLGVGE